MRKTLALVVFVVLVWPALSVAQMPREQRAALGAAVKDLQSITAAQD